MVEIFFWFDIAWGEIFPKSYVAFFPVFTVSSPMSPVSAAGLSSVLSGLHRPNSEPPIAKSRTAMAGKFTPLGLGTI
jgi:hypothetical protein